MLRRLLSIAAFASFFAASHAAVREYNFTIGWLTRNPDGLQDRPVIGINDQWPIPHITADVGDRIVVNVKNNLGNQSTSLHFHGIFQKDTPYADGPAQVTQCAILPGLSLTYNFTVDQPGRISPRACKLASLLTAVLTAFFQGPIGTTAIPCRSTRMDSGGPLSSTTQIRHSRTSTTKSSS